MSGRDHLEAAVDLQDTADYVQHRGQGCEQVQIRFIQTQGIQQPAYRARDEAQEVEEAQLAAVCQA